MKQSRTPRRTGLRLFWATLLLTITLLGVSTSAYSQTIKLSERNIARKRIIDEIEKQSDYSVIYSGYRFDDTQKV